MTEDEAKTKWCPFSQMQTGHVALGNRIANGQPMSGAQCIGSACMMWRARELTLSEMSAVKDEETAALARKIMLQGYCGLAGKP